MIDLRRHLYGPYALRVPKSAGRFVDIAGYISAELSHVAPVQVRCSAIAVSPRGAELRKRLAGLAGELLLSPLQQETSLMKRVTISSSFYI